MKSDYKGGGFDRSCYSNQKGFAEFDPADSLIQTMIDPNENPLYSACHDYNRYQQ